MIFIIIIICLTIFSIIRELIRENELQKLLTKKSKNKSKKKIKVNNDVAKKFFAVHLKETYESLTRTDDGDDLVNTFGMSKLLALNWLGIYIGTKDKLGDYTVANIILEMIDDIDKDIKTDKKAYEHMLGINLKQFDNSIMQYYFKFKVLYSKTNKAEVFNNFFVSDSIIANKNVENFFKVSLVTSKFLADKIIKY